MGGGTRVNSVAREQLPESYVVGRSEQAGNWLLQDVICS